MAGYRCPQCKDLGWVYRDVQPGDAEFGKALRCSCKTSEDFNRRANYLTRIDGLTKDDRGKMFERYVISDSNRSAYDAVREALWRKAGMVTLRSDGFGVGKTHLLLASVNTARNNNIPAVYTTTADLLDYLRQAYHPENQSHSIDERWDLLLRVDVLCIDELEKFNTTAWALEKFTQLLHWRYRYIGEKVTLLATNARLESLPGDIRSRLSDNRARVCAISGIDMRQGVAA